ncbi:MAG: hypothetical protein N3B01_07895, partial [Verrucomicrobiae bacterium]|nr:hypothetical protein [Verrucomicrobiae bacterium]
MHPPTTPDSYAAELEAVIAQCLQPLKSVPFKAVIRAIAGCKVIDFDPTNEAHKQLAKTVTAAAQLAGKSAFETGIFTKRPNEAGNKIEPFVRTALAQLGLEAKTPTTPSGKTKVAGYPDIEVVSNPPCYLECKTYNISNVQATMRAFYISPSKQFKVTKDALHLLLAYQLESAERKDKIAFVPVRWKLITLHDLKVDLKYEFNQNNKNLYGQAAATTLIAEGSILRRPSQPLFHHQCLSVHGTTVDVSPLPPHHQPHPVYR